MTRKEAEKIVGTLTNTSKMPGYSHSIPAKHCKRGSVLRKIKGSSCSKCYALKGRYLFKNVRIAQELRFKKLFDPSWVMAMTTLIHKRIKPEIPFFRWFDSGDIQNTTHFFNLIKVAENLPKIMFWLPTRELEIIRRHGYLTPKNLVIRVSANMIGEPGPKGFINTSSIRPKTMKASWPTLVKRNTNAQYHCPAPLQGGECKECRACWNKKVKNIVYLEH